MDKNWLIRTKSNHLLGPISKEKVVELYQNGSIKADDEITSGNGFWFFVREEEMVSKYLLGDEIQNFNPISEAKDILTSNEVSLDSVEEVPRDITRVGGIDLSILSSPSIPSAPEAEPASPSQKLEEAEMPKKKNKTISKNPIEEATSRPLKKQNYLKFLGVIGFLLLFCLIYFRKTIIRTLFHGEITFSSSLSPINTAYAQDSSSVKKKSF